MNLDLWRDRSGLVVPPDWKLLLVYCPPRFNIENGELVEVSFTEAPGYYMAQVERAVIFKGNELVWVTYLRCPAEEDVTSLLSEPVREYATWHEV